MKTLRGKLLLEQVSLGELRTFRFKEWFNFRSEKMYCDEKFKCGCRITVRRMSDRLQGRMLSTSY